MRRGVDPAAERARKKAEDRGALTLDALSAVFLALYGETKLKPRSLIEYKRAFHTHITPRIGKLKVRDVTHGDVERLHHSMRTLPVTANRTVAALSKFFSWAFTVTIGPTARTRAKG